MAKAPLMILISGPYSTGAKTDEARAKNLKKLNDTAFEVYKRGHIPIVCINLILPLLETSQGTVAFKETLSFCLGIADRCDAILRIEGDSTGGDAELKSFQERGAPVFSKLEEIPGVL